MTDSNEKPLVPNYVPDVGRLATDRFDFQAHVNGTAFRHQANQIDLSPLITIDGNTATNVQQALQYLAANLLPPPINQATVGDNISNLGIITLGGDLSGVGSTALSPRVSGLQGRPISSVAPLNGYVLAWNNSTGFWSPAPPGVTMVNMFGDVTGPSNASVVSRLQGIVNLSGTASAGTALVASGAAAASWQPITITLTGDATGSGNNITGTNTTVGRLQGSVVLSGAPVAGQVLEATSPTAASWQYPTTYGEIYSTGTVTMLLGPVGGDGYNYTVISCLNAANPTALLTTPSGSSSNIVVANGGVYQATFNCQFKLFSEAAEILAFQFFVNGTGVGMVQAQSALQIDLMSSFGLPYINTYVTFSPTQSFSAYLPADSILPAGLFFNFSMSHIINVPAGGTVDVRVSTGEGTDQFYMYGSLCLVSI